MPYLLNKKRPNDAYLRSLLEPNEEGGGTMNRICDTCGEEKSSIKGTFQQVCTTPECVVIMIQMLLQQNGFEVE